MNEEEETKPQRILKSYGCSLLEKELCLPFPGVWFPTWCLASKEGVVSLVLEKLASSPVARVMSPVISHPDSSDRLS